MGQENQPNGQEKESGKVRNFTMGKVWEPCINIHKFVIQRQFVRLNYFKNTLSNIIVYCTITGSLKTIDSWTDLKKAQIHCRNIPLFCGFQEILGKKHPKITISRNWL